MSQERYLKNRETILQAQRKRYASDAEFRSCSLAQSSKWQKDNTGLTRARNRKSYYANQEKEKLRSRLYYQRTKKERKEILLQHRNKRINSGKHKKWVEEHRQELSAYYLRRYHEDPKVKEYRTSLRKRKQQPMVDKLRRLVGTCYICGKQLDESMITTDHVVPRTKGGSNAMSNLMPVHGLCNTKKGNRAYPVARPDLLEVA